MTKAEAIAKAMVLYDQRCEDARRKSITDMLADDIPEEQIDGAIHFSHELQAHERPAYRRQVEAEIADADRYFRSQPS